MRQINQIFATVLFAVALAPTATLHAQDAEDYKVYDEVVRHMFRDGVTQFDMNAKVGHIVIRERTNSKYSWSIEKENWEQVKIRLRSLSDETIAGYEAARNREIELKRNLDIPLKYFLIGETQLKKIFSSPNEYAATTEQWKEFYEAYPNSAGFNSFSRVGFDKGRRNALVYFVNWCGLLCGTGSYVHLEKSENGWAVINAAGMWIS